VTVRVLELLLAQVYLPLEPPSNAETPVHGIASPDVALHEYRLGGLLPELGLDRVHDVVHVVHAEEPLRVLELVVPACRDELSVLAVAVTPLPLVSTRGACFGSCRHGFAQLIRIFGLFLWL